MASLRKSNQDNSASLWKPLYLFAAIITAISSAFWGLEWFSAQGSSVADSFSYLRLNITQGQVWRLLTGNLLHTNLWHLAMNLAGLWVILFLHEMHYRKQALLIYLLFISLCLFEGLGLYFYYPALLSYVGLSGVLHGLFSFGAIMDITRGYRSGYLLLAGVLAKVCYEQTYGASDSVVELIGARVATESHLVGVISGIICAFIWLTYLYIQQMIKRKK
ncbi:rhombosortase [Shewanella sp.]|uniref:rhombosortase n=1 Tax=Shewanella sp. TaxID=50422 RepID=UPI004054329D